VHCAHVHVLRDTEHTRLQDVIIWVMLGKNYYTTKHPSIHHYTTICILMCICGFNQNFTTHVLWYCTTLNESYVTDNIRKERYHLRICCYSDNFITSPYAVSGLRNVQQLFLLAMFAGNLALNMLPTKDVVKRYEFWWPSQARLVDHNYQNINGNYGILLLISWNANTHC
jgi:hypothetical protein